MPTTDRDGAAAFAFDGVSDRRQGLFVQLARRLLPGVEHVEAEIAPYAAEWHAHNVAALAAPGPLWVVLGDSLSQGVGASSLGQSWVLQAARMLRAAGRPHRVVNLSISGARVLDVVEREIPAMGALTPTPDLVTVLVGSNDVVRGRLRSVLVDHYATLLRALPAGTFVAVPDRSFGVLRAVADLVNSAAANGAVVAVPARLTSRDRAEDHFHLDDHGYRLVAEDFVAAIRAHTPPPVPDTGRPAGSAQETR
ncbi:SGNH/GDSL hydrolase family protein [Jatrophihabitans sp. YIM 134969]